MVSGPDQGKPSTVQYAIIIERAQGNFSAYAPDLPGCVATGRTVEEVTREMRDAIQFRLDSMREDGEPIPEPTSLCDYVEAEVQVG
jgi:predicted RNase H-like HicB family nuclease